MKILMQSRCDALVINGGDTVQMLMTKKHLEQQGVFVDISTQLSPDLTGIDIVHLFNITRVHETYLQIKNAKNQAKKVVLSPIYHSIDDIRNYERKNLQGFYGRLVKMIDKTDRVQLLKTFYYSFKHPAFWRAWFEQALVGYTEEQRRTVLMADYILPNSETEMKCLVDELFGTVKHKLNYEVVPNGIDSRGFEDDLGLISWVRANAPEGFVFCPGRIEPRKNQISIINALINEKIPVVFAGAPNAMHRSYFKRFVDLTKKNKAVYYLGEISHNGVMTLNKYAHVSILASWFETTGLVGLESGLMGCNVVITEKGYTRDYYGDRAWYCNPENTDSIRDAVRSALESPRGTLALDQHIVAKGFNWQTAANKTCAVYKKLIVG